MTGPESAARFTAAPTDLAEVHVDIATVPVGARLAPESAVYGVKSALPAGIADAQPWRADPDVRRR